MDPNHRQPESATVESVDIHCCHPTPFTSINPAHLFGKAKKGAATHTSQNPTSQTISECPSHPKIHQPKQFRNAHRHGAGDSGRPNFRAPNPSSRAPEPLRGSLWQARSAYGGPPRSVRGFFHFCFEIWGSLSGSLGEPIRYFLGTEFERIFLSTVGKPSEALLGCSDPPFGVAFRRYLGRPGVLDFDNPYNAKP